MNHYSPNSGNISLSRAELTEIGEKMAENKVLKNTLETQNATINTLMKENKELKKQIKKLQDENKAKEQDMKKKFAELHSEQKKVNNELEKYEAVPEFKDILDLYSELLNFRKLIDNVLKSDPTCQEKRKLDKKIEEYKQKNLELEVDLRKSGAKVTAKVRSNELQQAENELKKLREQSQVRYMAKKTKIDEMKNKMKNSTTKLAGTITNALGEVRKHLETYKADLKNITKNSEEFVEKPVYDKIMNILLEQQNGLMKDMLQCNASGTGLNTSAQKDDTESLFDSDSDSPNEDDSESVHGDTKQYKIIMHNINEEWTDGLQDTQKVQAIIKTFTTLATNNINVDRVGKVNPAKKRPLKVCLPTFQHVQVILKNKHKLQNTCYAEVRISSFKKKTGRSNNSQKKNQN